MCISLQCPMWIFLWGGHVCFGSYRVAGTYGLDTYSKEVAQGYRETDGESRAAQVVAASLVRGGKDADHQLQGQEELHCHRLPRCCIVVELEGGQ